MTMEVRGVLRIYYSPDNVGGAMHEIRSALQTQLQYIPMLTINHEQHFASFEIDHELRGNSPLVSLLEKVAAAPGCTGALFMDVSSFMGHHHFISDTNTSAEQFKLRVNAIVTEVINNLTQVQLAAY